MSGLVSYGLPRCNCVGENLKRCIYKIFFVVCCSVAVNYASDIFSNARQYALAGAYTAMAEGAEATFTNPANLYLNRKHKFSMNLLGLGAELSNNAISHRLYQRYVGDYLDDNEIEHILSFIPQEGINLKSDAKLQGVSIAYGPVSLGVRGFSSYSSIFARELFELALRGNELDKEYHFNPVRGEGMSVADVGLGLSHSFYFAESVVKNIAFGATISYLQGLSYTRVIDSDFYTKATFSSIKGDGRVLVEYADGGRGYGLNVGTTIALFNNVRASVVVQNVSSLMKWDKNAQNILFRFNIGENGLEPFLDGDEPLDSVFVARDTSVAVAQFTTRLPSVLRIALTIPVQKMLFVNTEYEQGFDDTAISSVTPRLAVGAEFRPNNIFRMRFGASVGGNYENHYSGGVGLVIDHFCWDIAIRTYNGLTSSTSKGFGLATSIGIRY